MKTVLALAAVCIVQFLGGIRAEDNFRSSYFNIRPEHRLVGHVITTTIADSELSCAHKCLALDGCKSGNFRTSEKKHENCELSSRGPLSQTHDPALVHDEEFVFIFLENEDPGCFKLFQTFPTFNGAAATTFVISGELFLAFANKHNSSLGYNNIKLPVYQLQENNFTLNQTLDALTTWDVEQFTIHGEHFLSVANHRNGSSYDVDSVVYRWEAGQFKEFQRIPTNRAIDIHYFTVNERKFLLTTNYRTDLISIYEWKNGKFNAKIQDISMTFPYRCDTFTIHNTTYIACGRGLNANAVTVFKWSGSRFEPFQILSSISVYGRPHSFYANGTVYTGIGNYWTSENNVDTDSFIYRWDGAKFVHHQSVPTHGAIAWESFVTAEGDVFLVVANQRTGGSDKYHVKSAVYKMADNKFNLYQQLPTNGAYDIWAFTHDGRHYLVVVNQYDGKTYNIDSAVYVWK